MRRIEALRGEPKLVVMIKTLQRGQIQKSEALRFAFGVQGLLDIEEDYAIERYALQTFLGQVPIK